MEEELEIILRAIDDASGVFESVGQSAQDVGNTLQTAFEEATNEVDRLTEELAAIELGELDGEFDEVAQELAEAEAEAEQLGNALSTLEAQGLYDASDAADSLEGSASNADAAVEDLGTDLDIINAGMLLQTAEQINAIAGNAEGMAQEMNTAAISVGQLATQTGIAEPQMVSLVNTISNATFPNDEAMMYIKSLDQMGVASENLGASATNIDKINDAFGLGAQTTNSLAQELGVLGVDMNNVSTAFNALAYANANTVGGMENYYSFLRKYDSQFKELGYNVDQASVIIAAATQKFGGGRAALSGLSKALEEAGNDSHKLEEALGMQAGSIENATQLTGQYEGQLQALADEEAEHKTLLDQLGAAWEDVSLSLSGVLSPLGSAIGLIGEVGSFGMQVNGLKMLAGTLKTVVAGIRDFNLAKTIQNVLEGEGAIASIAGALGITTEAAAAEGATVAFGGLAVAEGAALWPILAIIAAIALFVVAVYEIGKAFGWWTDVGTMFEAIKAGIMRMWDAFVNHPDVQAVVSAITSAWNALVSAIGGVISAIGEFFGVANAGEFDIVRALIDGIGYAWQSITGPIRIVIAVVTALAGAFSDFYNGTLVPFGSYIMEMLGPVFEFLGSIWSGIVEQVQPVIDVFTQFQAGQASLLEVVSTVASSLWNIWMLVATQLGILVTQLVSNLLTWALQAGSNFLNGIITYVSQLPGRFWSYLLQVTNYVLSAGTQWVNNARNKANQLVSGVISFISQLPGKALSTLLGVVSSIASAGAQWISSAKSQATSIVSGVVGILAGLPGRISSALAGVVNAITQPFRSAYDSVVGIVNNIKNKVQEGMDALGQLGGAAGGEVIVAAGGETLSRSAVDLISGNNFNIATGEIIHTYKHESDPLDVNINENITLDLVNVPAHIDTDTLIKMLGERDVLKALTTNKDFQDLDANVKSKIQARINRSRGV